jgi:hypothetical protein
MVSGAWLPGSSTKPQLFLVDAFAASVGLILEMRLPWSGSFLASHHGLEAFFVIATTGWLSAQTPGCATGRCAC